MILLSVESTVEDTVRAARKACPYSGAPVRADEEGAILTFCQRIIRSSSYVAVPVDRVSGKVNEVKANDDIAVHFNYNTLIIQHVLTWIGIAYYADLHFQLHSSLVLPEELSNITRNRFDWTFENIL